MTIRRPLSALALASTLLPFVACDADGLPAETVGCDSTRQCLLGEICNVLEGVCVPEPEQAVLGSFYCSQVYGPLEDGSGKGFGSFSEVSGNVRLIDTEGERTMTRVNQVTSPLCQLVEGVFYILLFDSKIKLEGQGTFVRVAVAPSKLRPFELVDVTDPEIYQAWAARGELRVISDNYSQSGDTYVKIYVESIPVEGQPLRGFLDIGFDDIVPTPEPEPTMP
jgi:hypothetical protein